MWIHINKYTEGCVHQRCAGEALWLFPVVAAVWFPWQDVNMMTLFCCWVSVWLYCGTAEVKYCTDPPTHSLFCLYILKKLAPLKGSWIGYWRPATLKTTCQRWFVVVNVENGKMPNLQPDYKNKPPVVSEHWFWFKIHFIVVFLNIYRHKMTQKNVSASSDMYQCLQL